MSRAGDSTRDWLLKKLLKASRNLAEQQTEITQLKSQVALTNAEMLKVRSSHLEAVNCATRLAERVDDLEYELQQLKKVPPIAPNLTVVENPSQRRMDVLSVASANGCTRVTVARTAQVQRA